MAEIAHRRLSVGELVLRRAVQLPRVSVEERLPALRQHAHDVAVLDGRRRHDVADRVRLSELAVDVARDRLELFALAARIEAEVEPFIVAGVDLRELAASGLHELLLDAVLPAERLQHADRLLRLDDARREERDDLLVASPRPRRGWGWNRRRRPVAENVARTLRAIVLLRDGLGPVRLLGPLGSFASVRLLTLFSLLALLALLGPLGLLGQRGRGHQGGRGSSRGCGVALPVVRLLGLAGTLLGGRAGSLDQSSFMVWGIPTRVHRFRPSRGGRRAV